MEQKYMDLAKALHKKHKVVDAHLDLAGEVHLRRLAGETEVIKNRYLEHFREAGLNLVASSVFVTNDNLPEKGLPMAVAQIAAIVEDIESIPDEICIVKSAKEMDEAYAAGKIGILLYMEGLDPIGQDIYLLRALYEMGVRGASLTWSRRNYLGEGCCPANQKREIPGGLTEFGKDVLAKLEELHMFVDVSHLNNEGFEDLVKVTKNPFIASHSNAWEIHENYRCLRDDQMEMLASRGGVIGLNACAPIVGAAPGEKRTALSKLCDHVEYMIHRAGEDHVGYGFDLCDAFFYASPRVKFDAEPEDCLAHHGEMIDLTAALLSRGMSEETAIKVIGGNFYHYFQTVIG